ncbi:hypothetical protein ACWKWP_11200 [Agromyces soli]
MWNKHRPADESVGLAVSLLELIADAQPEPPSDGGRATPAPAALAESGVPASELVVTTAAAAVLLSVGAAMIVRRRRSSSDEGAYRDLVTGSRYGAARLLDRRNSR